jgi:quercetin dioxygenase-like cupin family protein
MAKTVSTVMSTPPFEASRFTIEGLLKGTVDERVIGTCDFCFKRCVRLDAPLWQLFDIIVGVGSDLSPSREVLIDEPPRYLAVLLATPEAVVTETRYPAGQAGADPHVHRLHADVFHIVEGAIVFLVGPDHTRHRIDAGGTVIARPGMVHGFDVAPDTDTVYLNVHAPGMGFDVYLRTRSSLPDAEFEAFAALHDIYDEPDDGGLPEGEGVISRDGLIETWRRSAPPGAQTGRVAELMAVALALVDAP